MQHSKSYPNIDMVQTGLLLKRYIDESDMSIKDIQEKLHLSCPQPIYRWMKGKLLPSVDHLLTLSELFGVHMEDLLVKKQTTCFVRVAFAGCNRFEERIAMYYKLLTGCEA